MNVVGRVTKEGKMKGDVQGEGRDGVLDISKKKVWSMFQLRFR